MKFGKEFGSQMVPEWREAYMNYDYLKTLLNDILISRARSNPQHSKKASSFKRKVTLFRAFSGLTSNPKKDKQDDQVITVSAMHNQEQGQVETPSYKTIFLRSLKEGGEFEFMFFRILDHEFNKVIRFYQTKVDEVVKEAEDLNIQMDALFALRIKVNHPDPVSAAVSPLNNETNTGSNPLEMIQKSEMSEQNHQDKMASLEVLNRIKINPTTETPRSTMRSVFNSLNVDLHYKKNEVKDAQGKLKRAFIEFHEKLRFLKNYTVLNQLAFSKIMKKYDKMVEESYFSQSDEVAKLIEKVEATFIKHFCNRNRQQGMDTLRPKAKREKHWVTFFVGCFFGCSLPLIITIITSLHARDLLQGEGRTKYMNTIFPLYSLFGFLVLHMLMYAGNVYYWTRFRVNYSFIFGGKPAVLSNLEMDMDPNTQSYKALTELLPLGLVIVVLLIAICPFNILYRTNRCCLLVCFWHCICAPLYIVTLPDFFLADQFTSQLLRNLEFYVCYYGWGDFKKREAEICSDSSIYKTISVVISVVPHWIRVLQCIRRMCEGRDSSQALNALKYFSTIVAVVARTIYVQREGE